LIFTLLLVGLLGLPGLREQVSYVSRAITAEEYNAAVIRTPGDCPLFAAGDLRSGRQVRGTLCKNPIY
jgi:hypothetical protein